MEKRFYPRIQRTKNDDIVEYKNVKVLLSWVTKKEKQFYPGIQRWKNAFIQ